MALQNIGEGNRDDAFYRYKMPRLVTKIEGRGNGIKTNVVNMVDVAKALARPPSYTTKYFGCVLGAMSKYDEKTGTSTVNGAHDTPKLASLLENFIKKYVQCYGCGNPETEIIISKQQMIHLKCAACGFLSDVDMRDKLNTFILNNPPEDKKSGSKRDKQLRRAEKERLKAGELADEADKKAKGATKKKKGEAEKPKKKTKEDEEAISPEASQHDDEEVGGADEDEVQWQTDTSAAAAEKRIQEQLTQATSEMVMMDIGNGEGDSKTPRTKSKEKDSKVLKRSASSGNDSSASTPRPTDASENNSAEKSRITTPRVATTPKPEDCQMEVANNDMEDEDEDEDEDDDDDDNDEEASVAPELDAVNIHDSIVREFRDYAASHTAAETSAYVMKKAAPKQEVLMALFEALFGGVAKGLSVEVAKKSAVFGKSVNDAHDQMHLLQIIEKYCGVIELAAIKETALVIKVFYDADVLEEEQVLQWFDQKEAQSEFGIDAKAAAAVRKQAAPFVDWLRTAEADSEGSEE